MVDESTCGPRVKGNVPSIVHATLAGESPQKILCRLACNEDVGSEARENRQVLGLHNQAGSMQWKWGGTRNVPNAAATFPPQLQALPALGTLIAFYTIILNCPTGISA
jgi:hypothetical protein